MGIRAWWPRPTMGPYTGPTGVDEDGNPIDPYGGPTTGDIADGVRDAIGKVQERIKVDADVQSTPQDRTRELDCSETTDETACNECVLKQGYIDKPIGGRYVSAKNLVNYEYQLYVANLRSAPLRFGYMVADKADPERKFFSVDTLFDYINRRGYSRTVQEWHFNACEFDGFWPGECTVVEAKGNYDHFLDENDRPKYPFVRSSVFDPWQAQMLNQRAAISVAKPQGQLRWCFMQQRAMMAGINISGLDPSLCEHIPMPGQAP